MPSKSSLAIARLVRSPLAKQMLEEMQLAGRTSTENSLETWNETNPAGASWLDDPE